MTTKPQAKNKPIVEIIQGIHVVRDDLLAGGSKRRFVDEFVQQPYSDFVYASPVYGGAQIAIAHACKLAGKRAHIFVAARAQMHPRTLEAKAQGAIIHQVSPGYLTNTQAKARAFALMSGACLLPFGLDTPAARLALAQAARLVRDEFGTFDEVWCAVGSGMLIRSLQSAALGNRYFGVLVGKESEIGLAHPIRHPLRFEQDAKILPPFPSCSNYDAKVWQHVRYRPGKVLFWNVMG